MFEVGELARVAVVGTSCSGKTTPAQALSAALGAPHVELDRLYWGPNWTPVPNDTFRMRAADATAGPRWICDGNYRAVRDIIWPRASAIVWLDYSFPLVMSRALRRAVGRCLSRKSLFAGNRESLRLAFLSRDSVLLWVLRTHRSHRAAYRQLFAAPAHAHLRIVELRSQREARGFLAEAGRAVIE